MPLAPHIRKFFWDINPETARPKSHPEYYIKRILELGDGRALKWLTNVFGKKKVVQVARSARISAKSKNYWKLNL